MAETRFPPRARASRSAADPLAEMAAQIRALDAAAEEAASRIGEAASKLGNRERGQGSHTRADLLAGLASALVDRTGEIRADCERLSALMERTAKLVADRDAAAEPAPGAEVDPIEPAPADEPAAMSRPERRPSDPSIKPRWLTGAGEQPGVPTTSTSEGVRLIATQMAIAGSTRGEIERRLRIQFGVNDAGQALDEIFGTRRSGVG